MTLTQKEKELKLKQERLAKALRENLRRRKKQSSPERSSSKTTSSLEEKDKK